MGVARVTYNNMVDDKNYDIAPKKDIGTKDEGKKNVLALVTKILSKLNRGESYNRRGSHGRGNNPTPQADDRAYKPWRFENSDNKSTKEFNGTVLKWYKNDCHPNYMWYGRRNCLC